MYYIVFDLEFNQDFSLLQNSDHKKSYPFEIIQIGAIKLDLHFNTIETFNHYIKPSIYLKISPYITEMTGITTEQLQLEKSFTEVYGDFLDFIYCKESILCSWGMSDMKELYRNASYHNLDHSSIPKRYINLQPYASTYFNISNKKLLSLKYTVEALNIIKTFKFHNALNDAYYTAEIFKRIHYPTIQPIYYDPTYVVIKPRKQRNIIDFDRLINQFEKMYSRKITEEEQGMIKLAYKMGKTNQFLK